MTGRFSLRGFFKDLRAGFLHFPLSSFDFVDIVRYCRILDSFLADKNRIKPVDALSALENRMSRTYYDRVFLAQTHAMSCAAALFPAYPFIMAEDITEDWLATVDFHKYHARDHSLHQPLTAYIVANLLGFGNPAKAMKIPSKPWNLLDFCVGSIFSSGSYVLSYAKWMGLPDTVLRKSAASTQFWSDLFYQTAILAALFHDMGYPWQYLKKIGYALGRNSSTLDSTIPNAQIVMERYRDRMILLPFHYYQTPNPGQPLYVSDEVCGRVEAALSHTHGLPGGLAFLELNDAIRNYPCKSFKGAMHDFSIEWAAMGIVMHDMSRMHKDDPSLCFDFFKDPLSSIVTLSDYLEEFNRPNADFKQRVESSALTYSSACESVELSMAGQDLIVTMKYKNPGQRASANHFKMDETNDYFGGPSPFLDMSSIGIENVVFKSV